MYSNILHFIIVLLIYTGYQPESANFTRDVDAAGIALLGILFYLYVRNRFEYFARRCASDSNRLSACASYHTALVNQSTALAIIIYALFIYVFDFKLLLAQAPLIHVSTFLANLLGIAPFLALLVIIWSCAFPTYRQFCSNGMQASAYLLSQLKINATVLLPWLLVSLVIDSVNLVFADFYQVLEQFPLAGILLFVLLLAMLAIYLPFVIIRLWGCKPLPAGPVRERLERFCASARIAYADIVLWNLFDGKLINAGVIGFIKKFRYILISPSLMQILDEDELEAVVAHEIGHVQHHHMIYYTLIIMGFAVFAYEALEFMTYKLLSLNILTTMIASGAAYTNSAVSMLLTILPVVCFVLYYRFCFGYFSRIFERQADAHALKMTKSSSGLIQSLEKIARIGSQNRNAPNWHHFGIAERIRFLESCDRDPSLIKKHDSRVARMVAFYAVLFIGAGAVFYTFGEKPLVQAKMTFLQYVMEKKVASNPENTLYVFSLGNVYYEQGNLKKAEACFHKALALNPDDPEILNNLAWLYATAQDKELYQPNKALELSQRAADLAPKPHILDTLGESYFINGQYEEAVRALELAIAARPENMPYYE
ncbi:MAG: M48 family metalloprotease, partial [Proteobacteria bacterium]|nr:M48 family metalloprotease [Pseudomonadota bacterium]